MSKKVSKKTVIDIIESKYAELRDFKKWGTLDKVQQDMEIRLKELSEIIGNVCLKGRKSLQNYWYKLIENDFKNSEIKDLSVDAKYKNAQRITSLLEEQLGVKFLNEYLTDDNVREYYLKKYQGSNIKLELMKDVKKIVTSIYDLNTVEKYELNDCINEIKFIAPYIWEMFDTQLEELDEGKLAYILKLVLKDNMSLTEKDKMITLLKLSMNRGN